MDADPSLDNYQRYDVLIGHDPSGTSSQNMFHWRQILLSGEWKMYDYGQKQNMKRYKQKTPPYWDISNIKKPLHLYAGNSDLLADQIDVKRFWYNLPN